MPLINGTKELAIRNKLVEIYQAVDAGFYVFHRSRFITLKQHFEANTSKAGEDRNEIRYLQIGFTGFTDALDEAQLDEDCVPVYVNYELEAFAQHVGTRSDASNSEDDYIAWLLALRNETIDNGNIVVTGLTYELGRLVQLENVAPTQHEVMDVNGYISRYTVSVRVDN